MITDTMNTTKKTRRVFSCSGFAHVTTGTALLRLGKGYVCPRCGKPVEDATDTPVGKAYFAFARPDLSEERSS